METTTRLALALALLPTVALSLQWLRNRAPPREIQNYRKEAAVAIRLARRCGRAMREADTKARTTIWKDGDGGIDPCTATDEANEKLVVEGLGAAFPTHRVVGEESCSANGVIPVLDDDDVPTWIVDPIDGTQNFVHGLPCSVVSIGMAVRGVPRLGVVLDPYRDELWVAAAGEGAYLNGRRLKVAAAPPSADLSAYTVLTDLGYERGPAAKPLARLYASLLDKNVRAVRILGSTVLNLCYVASGRASSMVIGLVERDCPKPWDWCAGHAGRARGRLHHRDGRRPERAARRLVEAAYIRRGGDLLSRSCVCAEVAGACTRLRVLARDAVAGRRIYVSCQRPARRARSTRRRGGATPRARTAAGRGRTRGVCTPRARRRPRVTAASPSTSRRRIFSTRIMSSNNATSLGVRILARQPVREAQDLRQSEGLEGRLRVAARW